ncbi:MAG: hypothetical protein WA667_00350 [Candidatus Nitrosopolaris sp.]
MGRKIPDPIRRNVLIEWLEGVPRQQIARDNQIGTGTVSEIIQAIKEKESDARIDVLRLTALILRREGSNTDTLLESIRLKNFLDEIGLKGEKLEDFARHLDIHCFKRGLTPDAFMNLVANISSLSDSLGVPVEELPRSINSSKELLDDFNLAIKDRVLMLKRVNENYNVKITDLEEYRRNRPLIETLEANNLELEKAKKRIFDLEAELFKRQQEWSASNSEFELVNTELKPPIESAELYNLAKDLYLHPSKHADVIRNMRQRSGPQGALVDTSKVNIFDPPPPPASLPSGTPIYRTGTAQNPTQPTQSELPTSLPGLLKGVNPVTPVNLTGDNPSPAGPTNKTIPTPTQTNKTLPNPSTSTTTMTQPTNTLPFNNSNPNPPPTQQNTTTAITPPPPSASNPSPNSITSSVPGTSENNTTPTPNTPSNQKIITQGCSQGSNPPPTQQNTTTNLAVDCNANPNDRSCLQQNINNKPSPDNGKENHNNGGSDSVAVHETCTEK